MQCPICGGNVYLIGPREADVRIFDCNSCGSYEIEKSHLLRFLALPVSEVLHVCGHALYHPGQQSYSLGSLCEIYGISLESHHRALYDAQATAQLPHLINRKREEQLLSDAA